MITIEDQMLHCNLYAHLFSILVYMKKENTSTWFMPMVHIFMYVNNGMTSFEPVSASKRNCLIRPLVMLFNVTLFDMLQLEKDRLFKTVSLKNFVDNIEICTPTLSNNFSTSSDNFSTSDFPFFDDLGRLFGVSFLTVCFVFFDGSINGRGFAVTILELKNFCGGFGLVFGGL